MKPALFQINPEAQSPLNKSKTEKQYEHSGVAKSESVHKSERDALKGP